MTKNTFRVFSITICAAFLNNQFSFAQDPCRYSSLRPLSAIDARLRLAISNLPAPRLIQKDDDPRKIGFNVWPLQDEEDPNITWEVTDYGAYPISIVIDGQKRLWYESDGSTVYDTATKRAVAGGMPLMFPWTSRIRHGKLTLANGREIDLTKWATDLLRKVPDAKVNAPGTPEHDRQLENILHGITDKIVWAPSGGNKSSITLLTRLRDIQIEGLEAEGVASVADVFGDLEIEVTYSMKNGCLKTDIKVTNLSKIRKQDSQGEAAIRELIKTLTAKFSLGLHPWYLLGETFDAWHGYVDADSYVPLDDYKVPTGNEPQSVSTESRSNLRETPSLNQGFCYEVVLTGLNPGGEGNTAYATLTNAVTGEAIIAQQDITTCPYDVFWTIQKPKAAIGSIQQTTSAPNARQLHEAGKKWAGLVEVPPQYGESGDHIRRFSSSVTFSRPTAVVLSDLRANTKYELEFLQTIEKTRRSGHRNVSMSLKYKGKIFIMDENKNKFIELNDVTANTPDRRTHLASHRKNPNVPVLMMSYPWRVEDLVKQNIPIGAISPDHVVLTQEKGDLVVVGGHDKPRYSERVADSLIKHNVVLGDNGAVIAVGTNDRAAGYAVRMVEETARTISAALDVGVTLVPLTQAQASKLLGSGYETERSERMKTRKSAPQIKTGDAVVHMDRDDNIISEAQALRKALVAGGKQVSEKNLVVGPGGNISARLPSYRNIVLIKAKGSAFEDMEEDEYVAVDLESGKPIEMDGLGPAYSPSTETLIHLAIYKVRSGVQAICHTHPSCATGIATAGKTFEVNGAQCPRLDFLEPGSDEFAGGVAFNVDINGSALIGNHGIFTTGVTLNDAVDLNFTVEDAAVNALRQPDQAVIPNINAANRAFAQMI